MSAADDAWQEWEAEHYGARGANAETQRLFKSAYRRALEDAADACKKWRHDPDASEFIERELRGRAVEVGTKDGADDE